MRGISLIQQGGSPWRADSNSPWFFAYILIRMGNGGDGMAANGGGFIC